MKVSFVGIGLMNGSLSLDLQRLYPDAVMQGISRKETTLSRALDLGFVALLIAHFYCWTKT